MTITEVEALDLWLLQESGGGTHREFLKEETRDSLEAKGFIRSRPFNWIEITTEGREALAQWEKEND